MLLKQTLLYENRNFCTLPGTAGYAFYERFSCFCGDWPSSKGPYLLQGPGSEKMCKKLVLLPPWLSAETIISGTGNACA
jgi:hypothetical protein